MPERKNWKRHALEVVVIVGSILLAFGIEAWWAQTQENDHLEGVLDGIASGLAESRTAVAQATARVSASEGLLQRLIAMQPDEAARVPSDSTSAYLESVHRPYTFDNNVTFLKQALNDEVLGNLTDPDFQSAVVRWREVVTQLGEIGQALELNYAEALKTLGQYEEVGRMLVGQAATVDGEVLGRVRADRDVFALAVRKAVLMSAQLFYLRALEDAQASLLGVIQAR